MKKLFASLAIILAGIGSSFAENNSTAKEPKTINLNKNQNRPSDIRDEENLSCVYVGGQLHFEFAQSEGSTTVDVSKLNTGERITAQNNGYYFVVTMGDTPGFYEISVSTAEGNVYSGFLTIE